MNVKSIAFACCPSPLKPLLERIEKSPLGYRFAKGVFWSLAGAVVSQGSMLAATILIAHILGPELYGEYGIVRSTVNMFIVFAGFGLGLTAAKHVAEFRDCDPLRAGRVMAMSGMFAMVSGGAITVGLLIFAPWLAAHVLNAPHLAGVLRIGAVILFLNAMNGAQTGALSGLEAFKTIAKVNLGVGLAAFPLMVGGAYFGGLTGAVWALAINMGFYWLLNHIALRREAARCMVPFTLKHCGKEWPLLWKFSLPAAAGALMVGPFKWVCDALLVNQVGGYEQMGIFTAALIFQNAVLFVGAMLSAPLLSMICNAQEQVDDRLGRINILSSWTIGVTVALPLMCFPEMVEFLFGQAYSGSQFRVTLVLIMFYTCIVMSKQGLARVLAANNLMWWGFASNAFWALVLICSAWSLVQWGAAGLAASFAIAYMLNTLVLVPLYHSRKLVPKGTLISLDSFIIWSVLALLVFLNLIDVSLLIRGIAFVPCMLFTGIAFWRIAGINSRTNRPLKTIAVKGSYGHGNFGDDAIMFAAYIIVKRVFDSENIVLICKDSHYIQKIIAGAKVVQPNSADALNADMIVYGGGMQFFSFPLTYKRGIYYLWGYIVRNVRKQISLLAQKAHQKITNTCLSPSHTRVVAIGIGVGPFVEKSIQEYRTKKLFTRMDYIALRDMHSYQLCNQWKCKNISLCSDLCYLPNLWQTHISDFRIDDGEKRIKKVGIIIRDWPHTNEGDSYAGPLFQVVEKLRSAGKKVEFISFSRVHDEVWAKRLESRHENVIAWDPEQRSISHFIEFLSGYNTFITSRYHGAVFASLLGKPVVCIEVEQKMRLVSELFKDGARLWLYPFRASECIEHIFDIEDNYSRSVECLAKVLKKQNTLAEQMVSEFRKSMQDLMRNNALLQERSATKHKFSK